MSDEYQSKSKQEAGAAARKEMPAVQLLWLIIPILAGVFLLVLIAKNGVNVPFGDEWAIPGQFLAQEKHTFANFFAQSNESRLLIPKALFLAASKVAGWQPKHYMYFGWLIALWIGGLIYILCFRPVIRRRGLDSTSKACLVLASLLLLSPAAYENWLWGLQWVIYVPLLCVLIAFRLQDHARSFWFRYLGTVFLNTIAMFSFANGMLVWVISFPFWKEGLAFFLIRRGKARITRPVIWSLVYALTAAVFISAYFNGYQRNLTHPSFAYALQHPWITLQYFAAWCGGSLHGNAALHVILGFLVVGSILFLVACIAGRIRQTPGYRTYGYTRMLYPSLVVAAYAMSSGMLTTLGRAGFGIEQAWSSRYLFHSGALMIGLIAALNAHRAATFRSAKSAFRYSNVLRGVLLVLLILAVRTWNHSYKMFELMKIARTQDLLTVRLLPIVPNGPMVHKISLGTDLSGLVKTLKDRHIYDAPEFGSWIYDALRGSPAQTKGIVGFGTKETLGMTVTGWGILPNHNRPADSVLICRATPGGNLEPWMMIAVGRKRNDVVKETGQQSLSKSGFMETFPWKDEIPLPPMSVFAVDERNRQLYRISEVH